MMRITIQHQATSIVLRLEGNLAGPWVQELRTAWTVVRSLFAGGQVALNLTEVSSIDAEGRALLTEIHNAGGVLNGSGLFANTLVQQLTGISE